MSAIAARPALWTRAVQVGLLQKFAAEFRESVFSEGMSTTDGVAAVIATGGLNQEVLSATIAAIPEGTWELVCHPGYMDADLAATGTRLLQSRRIELDALLSSETKQILANRGISLISYRELR
jgi:predicted glycoside hydrolase/deacetylase ChbG (UPF0249 family)